MIASRAWHSATPSAANSPSPSGPRWRMRASIARAASSSGGRPSETTPQMPHTSEPPGFVEDGSLLLGVVTLDRSGTRTAPHLLDGRTVGRELGEHRAEPPGRVRAADAFTLDEARHRRDVGHDDGEPGHQVL